LAIGGSSQSQESRVKMQDQKDISFQTASVRRTFLPPFFDLFAFLRIFFRIASSFVDD
jgi:hypothetical protein